MEHFFRLVLLYAVFIVPVHFLDIEDKFLIQVSGIVGITLAYFLALLILKKIQQRREKNEKQNG